MKRPWITLLFGLVIGFSTYLLFALNQPVPSGSTEKQTLAWMKKEFRLNSSDFTRVCQMHREYAPHCRAMCQEIDAKNAELQKLLSSTNRVTPEIERALQEVARVRTECQSMMLGHFYRVSRAMPPAEGNRYLTWIQQQTLFLTNRPVTLQ